MPIVGEWKPGPRRRCDAKVSLAKRVKAQAAAQRLSERLGKEFEAYECPDCGRWHVGSVLKLKNLKGESNG